LRETVLGPRVEGVQAPALVLTDDWWVYNTSLAALNCWSVPDCPVLYAWAPRDTDVQELRLRYPGRTLLRAIESGGTLIVQPLS
jgi:hypothetical protein